MPGHGREYRLRPPERQHRGSRLPFARRRHVRLQRIVLPLIEIFLFGATCHRGLQQLLQIIRRADGLREIFIKYGPESFDSIRLNSRTGYNILWLFAKHHINKPSFLSSFNRQILSSPFISFKKYIIMKTWSLLFNYVKYCISRNWYWYG